MHHPHSTDNRSMISHDVKRRRHLVPRARASSRWCAEQTGGTADRALRRIRPSPPRPFPRPRPRPRSHRYSHRLPGRAMTTLSTVVIRRRDRRRRCPSRRRRRRRRHRPRRIPLAARDRARRPRFDPRAQTDRASPASMTRAFGAKRAPVPPPQPHRIGVVLRDHGRGARQRRRAASRSSLRGFARPPGLSPRRREDRRKRWRGLLRLQELSDGVVTRGVRRARDDLEGGEVDAERVARGEGFGRETSDSTAAARIASGRRRARRTWMIARASTGSRRRRIMLETCGRTRLSSTRRARRASRGRGGGRLRARVVETFGERAKGSFARCARLRASSPKVKTRRARLLAFGPRDRRRRRRRRELADHLERRARR